MNGKGSQPRPCDRQLYGRNYDTIFSTCSLHPAYDGKRPPRADCMVCRRIWRERKIANVNADAADNLKG